MTEAAPRPRLSWGLALLLVGFVLGAAVFGGSPSQTPEHTHPIGGQAEAVWTCSMHPQVRQPEPGACPICGMDLIPATKPSGGSGGPERVVLSDRARALARLRTAEVRRQGDEAAELRLLGEVEPNERTLKTVTAWVGGRIDRLHVNATGERVRAGQVIATLYSPELLAAHQDLLVARRQIDELRGSPASAREAAAEALDAARDRLRLLGVPSDALMQMEEAEHPARSIPIRSPYAGTVIERLATEGAYVDTGSPLYRVADLRSVWVQLDAYESDLPRLSRGQSVQLTVRGLPGEAFEGKITFIDPTLDPSRRTAQVRVQVDNRSGRIRPGMFAEATVRAARAESGPGPLVIPATAPLFTGRRALVYVEEELDGRLGYDPRTVRLGPKLGGYYPVVAGLSEGERVVSRGAFVLDADLQIRGGPSMMAESTDDGPDPWAEVVEVELAQQARLGPVVAGYLAIQEALADDDPQRAQQAARRLREAAAMRLEGAEAEQAWSALRGTLREESARIAKAPTIEEARARFEPLSEALIRLLGRLGNPLDTPVRLAYCPMAAGSEGAFWVQPGEVVDNAYFGASMLTCGEIKATVEPKRHLEGGALEEATR